MEQEFLALKWVIAEQFQEYILWKPFIVRTNNNPLTYIFITSILVATQHWWVELLAKLTFSTEYQKDRTMWLQMPWPESLQSWSQCILDGVTLGMTERPDTQDLAVAEADKEIHKQVQETANLARAAHPHVNYMWLTGWPPNRRTQYLDHDWVDL